MLTTNGVGAETLAERRENSSGAGTRAEREESLASSEARSILWPVLRAERETLAESKLERSERNP
jgi:hypothetical protein